MLVKLLARQNNADLVGFGFKGENIQGKGSWRNKYSGYGTIESAVESLIRPISEKFPNKLYREIFFLDYHDTIEANKKRILSGRINIYKRN